jgi:hypothetical protein
MAKKSSLFGHVQFDVISDFIDRNKDYDKATLYIGINENDGSTLPYDIWVLPNKIVKIGCLDMTIDRWLKIGQRIAGKNDVSEEDEAVFRKILLKIRKNYSKIMKLQEEFVNKANEAKDELNGILWEISKI